MLVEYVRRARVAQTLAEGGRIGRIAKADDCVYVAGRAGAGRACELR